jgi:transcription initiation factor TFIIB
MSCPPDKIVYDSEFSAYICTETGEVLDDRPIVSEQYRGEDEVDDSPIPFDVSIHDYGVGTDISRLDYGEARAVTLHHILREMTRQLGLPRYIQEDAAELIRALLRKRLTQGRRTRELITAILYASIRRYGLPIGLDELCRKLGADKRRVWSYYKSIYGELGLKQKFIPLQVYIVQVTSRLGVDYQEYQQIIDSILSRLPADLRYRKPLVVAQAVVLIALLIKRGKRGVEM